MRLRNLYLLQEARRGSVTVEVAVLAPVLVAIMAFAVDGGMAFQEKRKAQACADAAALAAATDLYSNWPANSGTDTNGTALSSAQTTIVANGYVIGDGDGHMDGTSNASVKLPGQAPIVSSAVITDSSGNIKPGYAEVCVVYYQPPYFSTVFTMWTGGTQGAIPIWARACSRGTWQIDLNGVIALSPTDSPALYVKGGGNSGGIQVVNGNLIVDSNAPGAVDSSGNHADIFAPAVYVTGGGAGNFFTDPTTMTPITPHFGVPPTPDPLAYLPEPSQPAVPSPATTNGYLNPGYYANGLSGTLNSGLYWVDGGLSGNISMAPGAGVTIFLNTGGVVMAGNSSVSINAATSGPYAGIAFFQARANSSLTSLRGNGDMAVNGTWYAPSANFDFRGNGTVTINSGQFVANTIASRGNGNVYINYMGPSRPKARHIQLVE
jgi:Flp pilus assembly protein TadG